MRRITLLLLSLLIVLPAGARAGSRIEPEITDPSGDAFAVDAAHGAGNADWADLVGAWLTNAPDGDGFQIHFATVKDTSAPNDDTMIGMSWHVAGTACSAELETWVTDRGESQPQQGVSFTWPEPSATIDYHCNDGSITELLPISVKTGPHGTPVGASIAGEVVTVTVPFSAVPDDQVASYRGGTLELTGAWTCNLTPAIGYQVDYASKDGASFTIGS